MSVATMFTKIFEMPHGQGTSLPIDVAANCHSAQFREQVGLCYCCRYYRN